MYSSLIIDGYNLIGKWPALARAKKKDIELTREKLFNIIQSYCDFAKIKAIIVYDGRGKERTIGKGNPQVIYSKGKETADAVIESLVYKSDNPSKVRVVTDDSMQRILITGMGASFFSAKEFKEEINRALSEMRELLLDKDRNLTQQTQ